MASRILAVTIGNDYIKMSEVLYSSHKVVNVYYSASIPTPKDSVDDGQVKDVTAVAEAIKATLDNEGIMTRDVIFSLQSNKVITKEVVAPFMKEDRLMDYINTNATEYFPVNIDEYVFTYSILENILDVDTKKYRMMVYAAPVGMVERYFDIAEKAGLKLLNIDYVGNSTLQLTKLQIDDAATIVIQMGDDSTIITILDNNVLQLMRSVPYGRTTVANALVEKKGITYEQAMVSIETDRVIKESFDANDYVTDSLKYLANNISRVMDYYSSKNQNAAIEKAILITEGKSIYGIDSLFTDALGMKIVKIEELNQVIAEPSLNMSLPELTAYMPNLGCVLKPVNFVPRSALAKVKKSSDSKITKLVLVGAIAIAAVVVAIPLVQYISKKSENKDLQEKIDNVKSIQEVVNTYYTAKDKYTDLASFDAMATSADDQLGRLITFLEDEMPSDVAFGAFQVTDGVVTVSCTSSSKETTAAFLTTLKSMDNISNVTCASVSETSDDNGVMTDSFTVSFTFTNFAEGEYDEVNTFDEEETTKTSKNSKKTDDEESDDEESEEDEEETEEETEKEAK